MSLLEELKQIENRRKGEDILGLVESGQHTKARRAIEKLDVSERELINAVIQHRYGFKL